MVLTEIKQDTCDICGGYVIREMRCGKHTNGHWDETRDFVCGVSLHFSPNFMKVRRSGECSNDKSIIKRNGKRKKACELLEKYIKRMNIDDKFRKKIEFSLSQYLPNYKYDHSL